MYLPHDWEIPDRHFSVNVMFLIRSVADVFIQVFANLQGCQSNAIPRPWAVKYILYQLLSLDKRHFQQGSDTVEAV